MRGSIADQAAEPFRYHKGRRIFTEEDLQAERERVRRSLFPPWWQRWFPFLRPKSRWRAKP